MDHRPLQPKRQRFSVMPRKRAYPGLTDLFELLFVVGTAAHSIQILRNEGIIVARQCKPIQGLPVPYCKTLFLLLNRPACRRSQIAIDRTSPQR